MKAQMSIFTYVVAALVLVAAAGCRQEGPMEKAGRQVDKAAAKVGDKFDDAADKLKK